MRTNSSDHDLIVRGATVIDGTGAPGFAADVALRDGRISAVGRVTERATQEIDARGLCLAPGFIDVHTHDDGAVLTGPNMLPKVSQGVTTVVTGNCGVSLAPLVLSSGSTPTPPLDLLGTSEQFRFGSFKAYANAIEQEPAAVNVAFMAGHGTLRCLSMDDTARAASPAEIAAMRRNVEEALEAGAVGLSSGLAYAIAKAAPMEEVAAIAEVLRGTGALYTTHMRDEGDGVEESLEESFETAERTGVPLVISHHKCNGSKNFGRSVQTLERIEAARKRLPVHIDVYPYDAGSTVLIEEFALRAKRVLLSWSHPHPETAGRYLAEVAADWGVSESEAVERLNPAGAVYFAMDEEDVRRILCYSHAMIGSDGLPNLPNPHPRLWGAFPRVLRTYVRELGLLPLEDAIRKMTGLPAQVFGFADRGRIEPGRAADLVLFNPDTVADRATYERSELPATGIELVLVNGTPVYRDGESTGRRPGRLLRRSP